MPVYRADSLPVDPVSCYEETACTVRNASEWHFIQSEVEARDIPRSSTEDEMHSSGNGTLERKQTEIDEENRKIRRLQIMMSMVLQVLSQDPNLTFEEASELIAGSKRAALAMFPDKELAYDLIYRPRLQRVLNERFSIQ